MTAALQDEVSDCREYLDITRSKHLSVLRAQFGDRTKSLSATWGYASEEWPVHESTYLRQGMCCVSVDVKGTMTWLGGDWAAPLEGP